MLGNSVRNDIIVTNLQVFVVPAPVTEQGTVSEEITVVIPADIAGLFGGTLGLRAEKNCLWLLAPSGCSTQEIY